MRRVILTCILLVPLVGASSDQTDHALFLDSTELTRTGDPSCIDGMRRYEMSQEPPEQANVQPTTGTAAYGCATRFVFTAESTLRLDDDIELILHVQCSTTVARPDAPSLKFFLTTDAEYRTTNGPSLNRSADGSNDIGPVCVQESHRVSVDLSVRRLTVEPGDALTLLIWAYVQEAPDVLPPELRFVVGGDDPSRLEWRTTQQHEDPRSQALYLDAARLEESYIWCSGDVRPYVLAPTAGEASAAKLDWSAVHTGCETIFEFHPDTEVAYAGGAVVELWYRCTGGSVGYPDDFQFTLTIVDRTTLNTELGATQSGSFGSIAGCPTSAVAATPAVVDTPPFKIERHQALRLSVLTHYANVPEATGQSPVEVMVGGPHASRIVLPLATDQSPGKVDNATKEPSIGNESAPGPGIALFAAAFLACLARRRD